MPKSISTSLPGVGSLDFGAEASLSTSIGGAAAWASGCLSGCFSCSLVSPPQASFYPYFLPRSYLWYLRLSYAARRAPRTHRRRYLQNITVEDSYKDMTRNTISMSLYESYLATEG